MPPPIFNTHSASSNQFIKSPPASLKFLIFIANQVAMRKFRNGFIIEAPKAPEFHRDFIEHFPRRFQSSSNDVLFNSIFHVSFRASKVTSASVFHHQSKGKCHDIFKKHFSFKIVHRRYFESCRTF